MSNTKRVIINSRKSGIGIIRDKTGKLSVCVSRKSTRLQSFKPGRNVIATSIGLRDIIR